MSSRCRLMLSTSLRRLCRTRNPDRRAGSVDPDQREAVGLVSSDARHVGPSDWVANGSFAAPWAVRNGATARGGEGDCTGRHEAGRTPGRHHDRTAHPDRRARRRSAPTRRPSHSGEIRSHPPPCKRAIRSNEVSRQSQRRGARDRRETWKKPRWSTRGRPCRTRASGFRSSRRHLTRVDGAFDRVRGALQPLHSV